ncbi:hypothetical protein, partial [Mycolicibacterium phlei]
HPYAENSASWKANSASTSSPSTTPRDASGLLLAERLAAGVVKPPLELLAVGAPPRHRPRVHPALSPAALRLVHI